MGRMSDGSSVPREAQPGRQAVPEPKLPVGGIPCLPGMGLLSHQLEDARGEGGISANTGKDPVIRHLGPSINAAPCSRIQRAHFYDCNNPHPYASQTYGSQKFREQPAMPWFPVPSLSDKLQPSLL